MFAKYFGSSILLFSLSLSIFAQGDNNKESDNLQRQRFLVSQILADVPNLKLGENRAFVYAKVGTLTCKTSPQDSQPIFQRAVNELIGAQEQAESNPKRLGSQNEIALIQNSRSQILNLIASCDAGFALDSLYRTRSAAITKAINDAAANTAKAGSSNGLAQNELNMEQTLMRQAAAQDPERAIKLLNDALRKGISNETLELLTQLSQKDPAAAQAAASDVMNKLVRSKFLLEGQPDYQQIGTATNFLSRYTSGDYESQKSIFDDSQMRQLANNLVSFYLQQSERYGSYIVNPTTVVQIAEKLVPSSVEALKQKQRTNARNGDGFSVEYSKLMSTDASPETLVTEAKRLPLSYRNAVYQNAAARYAQRGELDRATALLNENLSDDSLDSALMSLRSQYASTLMYSGKFAEAEAIIDQLPEYGRSNSLLNLANVIYQSDPVKNKSYALAVLGKARSAISDQPENSTEFSNLMQIIAAYGNIAPDEAFRVFEPLIPQMNELTDAFATVNQFQGGGNMRQGEYLLSQGISFGYYYDLSIFRAFATNDFDRTMKLIDGFSRREVRLAMLIYLAENVSNQQNNVQNTPGVHSISRLSVISLNR